MADKYVVDGATFCGDGTSSNEAVSAGAVGAWNDLESLINGTAPAYGSISSGDTIHIRAKTSSGSNLSYTNTVDNLYYGSSAATEDDPILWLLDNGTIWPGVTGQLVLHSTGNVTVGIDTGNVFSGPNNTRDLIITFDAAYRDALNIRTSSSIKNAVIDWSADNSISNGRFVSTSAGLALSNVLIKPGSPNGERVLSISTDQTSFIQNVDIEVPSNGPLYYALVSLSQHSALIWHGGRIYGSGAVQGLDLFPDGTRGVALLENVRFPAVMRLMTRSSQIANDPQVCISTGCDEKLGMVHASYSGMYSSRDDGFFPKLTSTLPTSTSDKVSIYALTHTPREVLPFYVPLQKLVTQAPSGVKTITVEFLCSDALPTPTEGDTWVELSYWDSTTEIPIRKTSRVSNSTTALSTSLASWSTTTYGPQSYTAYKLELDTDGSIQQDSIVEVLFKTTVVSTADSQNYFIEPELVFS